MQFTSLFATSNKRREEIEDEGLECFKNSSLKRLGNKIGKVSTNTLLFNKITLIDRF